MITEPLTVRAGSVTLAYRAWGPHGAPPLLLLHCRGADGADWAAVAGELATARRVYAVDLRGHGRSDWPGDYSYELMRDDVRAFLTALAIERTDVIGHSLGGIVALLLAQEEPERIRRLVLEDAPAPFPLDPRRPPAPRPEGDLPFDWNMILATDRQRNAPDPAWWQRMDRVTVPTLLIGGGPASPIPQEHLVALAGRLPDARLVTLDAGHLVHATLPAEFTATVRPFLEAG
ncbi:alpha/beta fold hydrolase [Streptomyces sp. NPDC002004]